ncbi:chromosome transmission fidelity protein 8 homolog [Gigantopelta aegis]|uniref:chromosome transmission fidelity protein 8 homolog n=1 Tax=Gigantopelta aegis TaxID=1735272 RepID=UPI001B88C1CA|nr:chromosome transmission fidelity protein 8 homolog [Gigantopelta aegis]
MVQVFIKMPSDGSCPEWAILDVQGDLETRHNVPLSGKFIGDLHFTHKDAPVLLIGHHILYGKVVDLEKPLAVLIKNISADSAMETNQSDDTSNTTDQSDDTSNTKYTIQAVIKKKLLFKTRPKPIIANVPKKV